MSDLLAEKYYFSHARRHGWQFRSLNRIRIKKPAIHRLQIAGLKSGYYFADGITNALQRIPRVMSAEHLSIEHYRHEESL